MVIPTKNASIALARRNQGFRREVLPLVQHKENSYVVMVKREFHERPYGTSLPHTSIFFGEIPP